MQTIAGLRHLALILLVSFTFYRNSFCQTLRIQTVSEAGAALSGVKVSAEATQTPLRTNEEGRIEIQQTSPMIIRFTHDGYQPRTINVTTISDGQVVLLSNESALRYLPTCDPHPSLFRWRAVGVLLPKRAKVKDLECSDACTGRIRSGKSSLGFGFGFNWSNGYFPLLLLPERIHQVTSERELRRVGGDISLFEQRGTLANGRHFRFIGMPAVTISYDDASETEAAYFDQIMDSLCWNSEDTLWRQIDRPANE